MLKWYPHTNDVCQQQVESEVIISAVKLFNFLQKSHLQHTQKSQGLGSQVVVRI